MQHHLYKEPQDANECTPDDWKQTDIIRANLESEYAKKFYQPRSEMRLTLIIALSFTAGVVFMLLSGLFARIV